VGAANGSEQQRSAVGMLVGEDLMEPAGMIGLSNPPHFLDLTGVWQSGDVEDDGTKIDVGTSRSELERLGEIVPAVDLEIRRPQAAVAPVQLGVLDPPGI